MRIDRQLAATEIARAKPDGAKPTGDLRFSVIDPASGDALARPVAGPQVALPLHALMALQEEGEPLAERRKRAARRGLSLLAGLDQLKLGLLGGTIDLATLDRLSAEKSSARPETDDQHLQTILDAVDVRVAVELAKLGR